MVAASHAPARNRSLDWLVSTGDAVVVDAVYSDDDPVPALDDELAPLVARAADARRRDFAFGRRCAAIALESVGATDCHVGRREDRSPIWPVGWCGSISHSAGYAVAVVARHHESRGLGIDAESVRALDDEVTREVLTPSERGAINASFDEVGRLRSAAVAFAAKEAFFKAQYPLTGRWVDFTDVESVANTDPRERLRGVITLHARPDAPVIEDFDWPLEARWALLGDIVVVGVTATRVVAGPAAD